MSYLSPKACHLSKEYYEMYSTENRYALIIKLPFVKHNPVRPAWLSTLYYGGVKSFERSK